MKSLYISFLKKTLIFSAIIAVVAFVTAFFLPDNLVTPAMPFLLLFFVSISLITHYMVIKSFAKRMSQFANFFMISIFVKLLLYIAIIVVYAILNPKDLLPFVITFFVFYLFYTLFELVEILKVQKAQKKG